MIPAGPATVRVWVTDVWDAVPLAVAPGATVASIKAEALRRSGVGTAAPESFMVKYRGAAITDETRTLAELGVPDRAPLIVLPARRQPVR